jgi:hypothetical protein
MVKIVDAEIKKCNYVNEVIALFEDGTVTTILTYFPDEISFRESEFVGKTEWEATELFHKKDIAYLQS